MTCYKTRNENRNGAKQNGNCACERVEFLALLLSSHLNSWTTKSGEYDDLIKNTPGVKEGAAKN